jgi:hypothetical protein
MVADNPETFADLDGHETTGTNCDANTSVDCAGKIKTDKPPQPPPPQNSGNATDKTAKPQDQQAAVAAPAAVKVLDATMKEVDKVAKPLIESAAEKVGPAIAGAAKLLGVLVVVAAELALSPALNADESKMLHEAQNSAEHKKSARPSTEEKHEAGTTRKKKDRGGEKGDENRAAPRKRPSGWKGPWPPEADTK